MIYSMDMPGRVVAGLDSINKLPDEAAALGAKRVLIATDPGVYKARIVDVPYKILRDSGFMVDIIANIPPEPTDDDIRKLFSEVSAERYDCIVGIGGGSAMDAAKLISVMMKNDQDITDMIGNDKIKNRGIPSILVPTTAGTGSEATQNAIVMIPEQGSKSGVISGKLLPDCVILDHGLTLGLPPAITASTGMDALTHALECYISKKANPLSDTYALRAVSLILNSIKKAYEDGRDLAARGDMLIGAYYGGMSIAASGTAAVHALAYPLGGRYRIPHGVSNAILLAYVMEFNMDVIGKKLKEAAVVSGLCDAKETESKAAGTIIEKLHTLTRELEIPSSLRAFDIGEKDIEDLADAALKVKRLLDNNPKEIKKKDMIDIYRKII